MITDEAHAKAYLRKWCSCGTGEQKYHANDVHGYGGGVKWCFVCGISCGVTTKTSANLLIKAGAYQ